MDLSEHKTMQIFLIGLYHCDINVISHICLIAMILFQNVPADVPL